MIGFAEHQRKSKKTKPDGCYHKCQQIFYCNKNHILALDKSYLIAYKSGLHEKNKAAAYYNPYGIYILQIFHPLRCVIFSSNIYSIYPFARIIYIILLSSDSLSHHISEKPFDVQTVFLKFFYINNTAKRNVPLACAGCFLNSGKIFSAVNYDI